MLSLLTSFTGGSAVSGHGVTGTALNGSTSTTGPLPGLLNGTPPSSVTPSAPKAGINWILFDEQFRPVSVGFDAVDGAETIKTHQRNAPVTQNGYLYVYCSDESNVDVFFHNLQVIHNRGPLLEETHYYPFGLTMSGISSKAAGSLQNRNKFNGGNELQSGEFSDGSGLELYDAKNRMYDAQIGRFGQIDPLADMSQNISPYAFGSNNPISINDPLGLQDSSHTLSPVTVTTYIKNKANQFANWFTGANVGYNGSGWGHGPRQFLSNELGMGGDRVYSFWGLMRQSMLQNSNAKLSGQLLNELKSDPALIAFQNKIIAALKKIDPRLRKTGFVLANKGVLGFGGQRWTSKTESWSAANGNNPLAHADTWSVASNELTWSVRNASVDYTATIKSDGTAVISYHLNDTFDLTQGNRSEAYDNITTVSGAIYHDILGGNRGLKVSADWQTTVKF